MKRETAGFSLIEAMTVLAILAISLTLALPAFSDALHRNRIQTAMHLVSAGMAMARSSAVMRHSAVVVCPQARDGGCGTDGDWSRGWIVFSDSDGNRQPDAEQNVLRREDAPTGGDSALRIVSSRPFLRYQADGRSAHSNLTLHLCADGGIAGQVIVNNTGRVRTSRQQAGKPCPAP